MKRKSITTIIWMCLLAVVSFSCKSNDDLETGTEFPREFLGVWEADPSQDPDNEGSFIHFQSDTVTYYGRVGEVDYSVCYVIIPIYEIIKYKGNTFTLNILGLDEEVQGELTIKVKGDVMEWVISKNDIDRWIKSGEEVSTFTPDCGVEFKGKTMTKFQNLRK